jgi:DNA-binding LytR/AlgR family response regulator
MIVEDEKPAQEVLRSFASKIDWMELVVVLDDAVQALEYLKNNEVDLIFLDIQMPTLNGLDFLKIVRNPPQVIITSAYSQYAIDAFDLDVRDYLMKPFSFDRFVKAVNRISIKPEPAQVLQFKHESQAATEKSFAFFNVNKLMVKVSFDDIRYVESMREYVYLHTTKNKIVTKMSTSDIEKMLGSSFLRIHRSFIVNIEKITAYNAEDVFIESTPLPIGVSYKKYVEDFFKHHFPEAKT